MKRGDKLDKALASGVTSQNENVLADMGLRYDLTLPLSRYFANNKDKLYTSNEVYTDGQSVQGRTSTEGQIKRIRTV